MTVNVNGKKLCINTGLKFNLLDDEMGDVGNIFTVDSFDKNSIFVTSSMIGKIDSPFRVSQFVEMIETGEIEIVNL